MSLWRNNWHSNFNDDGDDGYDGIPYIARAF